MARQIATIQDYHLKTIIGVGGDGTIHEIVNGLNSFKHVQIGFISASTGNDFARGFQISTNSVKAVRQLLNSRSKSSKQYDMGEFSLGGQATSSYFVNNLGVGFDAKVAKTASEISWEKLLNVLNKQLSFMLLH